MIASFITRSYLAIWVDCGFGEYGGENVVIICLIAQEIKYNLEDQLPKFQYYT